MVGGVCEKKKRGYRQGINTLSTKRKVKTEEKQVPSKQENKIVRDDKDSKKKERKDKSKRRTYMRHRVTFFVDDRHFTSSSQKSLLGFP